MDQPHSPSCDRNSEPIFEVLSSYIDKNQRATLVEIGSGTGQHAAYMASRLPHLQWQPTDSTDNHPGILSWTQNLKNVSDPLSYLAGNGDSIPTGDLYFTANTLHIMSWENGLSLFADLGAVMPEGSQFFAYGPFNIDGDFTSDSNRNFDKWLKNRDPKSGIRDLEDVVTALNKHGINHQETHTMPANNFFLSFAKK